MTTKDDDFDELCSKLKASTNLFLFHLTEQIPRST